MRRGSISIQMVILITLGLIVLSIAAIVLTGSYQRFTAGTNDATNCIGLDGVCELHDGPTCPVGNKVLITLCPSDGVDRENPICCHDASRT